MKKHNQKLSMSYYNTSPSLPIYCTVKKMESQSKHHNFYKKIISNYIFTPHQEFLQLCHLTEDEVQLWLLTRLLCPSISTEEYTLQLIPTTAANSRLPGNEVQQTARCCMTLVDHDDCLQGHLKKNKISVLIQIEEPCKVMSIWVQSPVVFIDSDKITIL